MSDPTAELVPLRDIVAAGAFTAKSDHARKTRARRWAKKIEKRGLAELVGGHWMISPSARLPDGQTIESFLKCGAKAATLNGFRLPPDADKWGESQRQRFLHTHELKRRLGELAAEFPKMTFRGHVAKFAELYGDWVRSVKLSCNPHTISRYLRRIDPSDALFDGNVDQRGRPRGGEKKRSADAWAYFRAEWLRSSQPKVTVISRQTRIQAKRMGWTWPSTDRIVQKWVKDEIPQPAKVMAREGPRAHYGKCRPKCQRDFEDIPAGYHWCGDERTLDFFVRVPDDRKGWRVIRPKFTAWVCVRSRKYLGWYLGERANSDTILASYKMGARLVGHGSEFTIDNGRDYILFAGGRRRKWDAFDENRIGAAIEQTGGVVHFAIKHSPASKMVESCFGTDLEEHETALQVLEDETVGVDHL